MNAPIILLAAHAFTPVGVVMIASIREAAGVMDDM